MSKLKIFHILILFIFASNLYSYSKYGELNGTVEDTERGSLHELAVHLREFEKTYENKFYNAMCRQNGNFVISGIIPGKYVLTVFRSGIRVYENGVIINKGKQRLSIVLKKESHLSPYMKDSDVGTISGRIYDSSSRTPLEDVSIMIGNVYTVSDAQGRYSASGIPVGNVQVHLMKKETHLPISKTILNTDSLTINDFFLEPVVSDMTLYGRVIDEGTQALLKGALITLNGKNYISNELGEFLAEGIKPDTEVIKCVISADGYRTKNFDIPFNRGIHRLDTSLLSGYSIVKAKKTVISSSSVKDWKKNQNQKKKHELVKNPDGFCSLSAVTGLADIPDAQVLKKDVFEVHARYINAEQGNSVDNKKTDMMLYGINVGLYNNLELGIGFIDSKNNDITMGSTGTTGIYNLKYRFRENELSPVNYALGYQKYHYDNNQVKDVDTLYFSMDYIFFTSKMMDKLTVNVNHSDFGDFSDTTFNLGMELTPLYSRHRHSYIIEALQDTSNKFGKINIGLRLHNNPGFDFVFSRNINNDSNAFSLGSHVKF